MDTRTIETPKPAWLITRKQEGTGLIQYLDNIDTPGQSWRSSAKGINTFTMAEVTAFCDKNKADRTFGVRPVSYILYRNRTDMLYIEGDFEPLFEEARKVPTAIIQSVTGEPVYYGTSYKFILHDKTLPYGTDPSFFGGEMCSALWVRREQAQQYASVEEADAYTKSAHSTCDWEVVLL